MIINTKNMKRFFALGDWFLLPFEPIYFLVTFVV